VTDHAPADAVKNYQAVLDQIFGPNETSVKQIGNKIHNVLGALISSQFDKFSDCFLNRLTRLAGYYPAGSAGRVKIIQLLQDLTHPGNWAGPYAELVAIDFLNFHGVKKHFGDPIVLENKLPATETWASSFPNRVEADLDCSFPELLDVYADVKLFQDTADDYLSKLVADFQIKYPDAAVLPQKPVHIREIDGSVRQDLLKELESTAANKETHLQSKIVTGLSYRLAWERPSVLLSEGTLDPYHMAETHHQKVFSYTDKFTKNNSFVLVFVQPPWREHRLPVHLRVNQEFCRAMSRRVFCQYIHSAELHKNLFPKVTTQETLYDVSRTISAIVFLVDESPECADPSDLNVKAYSYTNPNAKTPLNSLFDSYMREWAPIERFTHDNY